MLAAGTALLESGQRLKGDLWLAAVVGHEEAEAAEDAPQRYSAARRGMWPRVPSYFWAVSGGRKASSSARIRSKPANS